MIDQSRIYLEHPVVGWTPTAAQRLVPGVALEAVLHPLLEGVGRLGFFRPLKAGAELHEYHSRQTTQENFLHTGGNLGSSQTTEVNV